MKLLTLAGPALLALTLLTACNDRPAATTPAASAAPTPAPARYECPMKCAGSQSDKPGKCPVCEMDLEKQG